MYVRPRNLPQLDLLRLAIFQEHAFVDATRRREIPKRLVLPVEPAG